MYFKVFFRPLRTLQNSLKKRGVSTINLGFVYLSKRGESINNMGSISPRHNYFSWYFIPLSWLFHQVGAAPFKKKYLTLLTATILRGVQEPSDRGSILYFDNKGSCFIKKGLLYFKYFYPFFLQQQSYEGYKNHLIGVNIVFW